MDNGIIKPNWDNAYGRVALRGLLWTSPLWAGILLNAAAMASKEAGAFLDAWPEARAFLPAFVLFGASLCFFPGYAFSGRNLGVLDALKRATSSVLAVACAYLLLAFVNFLLAGEETGTAPGAAFGLIGAGATFIAAAMGAVIRLFFNLLGKLFSPRPEAPPEP
ncbi:MAG: hypothetical protein A2179_05130 [Elusimicrobia bacterium GWC2_63_65]|nr:MAG: hypothetical protein A2179_05130 [Elusimicrobia bacterium GWC2_63_65]